jgi:hypothetical protein
LQLKTKAGLTQLLFCYLQVLSHSPDAMQALLQVAWQVALSHCFAQRLQWFILLLQQGVPAKENADIVNNIIIVMKRNFFMIF